MNEIERLMENLGKLKRNESQMSEEQKEKYKAPLGKLKKTIAADASEVMRHFLMSGCRLAREDADSADWKDVIRKAERFIDEWIEKNGNKASARALFKDYDFDKFIETLLPLRYKIWYEAYGPYWISHCTPTFESEYTFTNDIIDMEWWAEHNEWASVKYEDGKKVTDYEKGVTIMLPPTEELLQKSYRGKMKHLCEAV